MIGVGVKNSTSDLLIANCDEFIYYDDLVREKKKATARRGNGRGAPATKPRAAAKQTAGTATRGEAPPIAETSAEAAAEIPKDEQKRRDEAVDLVVETIDALLSERGAEEKIWGSMVKQALKRRKPGFNESYYGFRSFNGLLEEAARRGELALDRDEKSGGYIVRLTTPED